MADALKTFKEGEDILASETNENNQFLLSKLSDNAAQVQSYVEGEVASIKSNVASVQATLQNNINSVLEQLEGTIRIKEFVDNGNSGYTVYTNNYCVQWGRIDIGQDQNVTVILKKAYRGGDYNVSAVMIAGQNGLSRGSFSVASIGKASFVICNGQDIGGSACWNTQGFIA
jgi:hypothetical protein